MIPESFRAPAAGSVIRTLRGYHAFVPAPPPRRIIYDDALISLLSQADAALSELSGLGRYLPNPELLIARAMSLLDELFINPYTTVARAAAHLGVALPTAQKTIRQLVDIGLLQESTGREWGRTWLARPILDAVNETKPAQQSARSKPVRQPSELRTSKEPSRVRKRSPPKPRPR